MTSSGNTEIDKFGELFQSYHKPLCNLAFRILKDKDAAQDVVQEVFLRLWNNRLELKIKSSIKAYLFRSVYNASLDYLQKWKRLQPTEDIVSLKKSPSFVEEKLEEKELEESYIKALDRLPPKCRLIFSLSRYDGMKHKEIAEHLGISIKTVEAQIAIALDRLKKDLKPFLRNTLLFLCLAANITGNISLDLKTFKANQVTIYTGLK